MQTIPEPVLKEWEQDLDDFANQVTQGLPEEKADSIRSVIHLASTLIQEVFFLRNQRHSQSLIRYNLHKQVLRLEKLIAGYCEPGATGANPGTGNTQPEPCGVLTGPPEELPDTGLRNDAEHGTGVN